MIKHASLFSQLIAFIDVKNFRILFVGSNRNVSLKKGNLCEHNRQIAH